jgi:hypothetical protein
MGSGKYFVPHDSVCGRGLAALRQFTCEPRHASALRQPLITTTATIFFIDWDFLHQKVAAIKNNF